jgi:hypothetical protein
MEMRKMLKSLRDKETSLKGEFDRIKGAEYYRKVEGVFNPFKPLPNTSKFKLGEASLDLLFQKYGFKKTIRSEPLYEPYDNTASNRYLFHQVLRLNKARNDPEKFGRIAQQCIRRSNNFVVIALNHCFPQ